jgi:hypothetical protein
MVKEKMKKHRFNRQVLTFSLFEEELEIHKYVLQMLTDGKIYLDIKVNELIFNKNSKEILFLLFFLTLMRRFDSIYFGKY